MKRRIHLLHRYTISQEPVTEVKPFANFSTKVGTYQYWFCDNPHCDKYKRKTLKEGIV